MPQSNQLICWSHSAGCLELIVLKHKLSDGTNGYQYQVRLWDNIMCDYCVLHCGDVLNEAVAIEQSRKWLRIYIDRINSWGTLLLAETDETPLPINKQRVPQ